MIVSEEKKLEARTFYLEALKLLQESGMDFMRGGMVMDTKDLDIFCLPADLSQDPEILCEKWLGYRTYGCAVAGEGFQKEIFHGYHFQFSQ